MDDKKKLESPAAEPNPIRSENQWVMIFNVITGKGKDEVKRSYKLNKNQVVVGSALSSDIRIQQNSVSNVHAIIEMDSQGGIHIYDMASETGVFINDKRVVSEEVKDGDEIKIGFAILTFKRQSLTETRAQLPKPMVRSSGSRSLFLNDKEDFRPLILEDERDVIQIFDYPSGSEQAMQVVQYWDDVILDVKHFVDQEPVTIGENSHASFLVPGLQQNFSVLSFEGGGYTLHYTAEMDGVIRSGKKLISLADLKKQNPGGSYRVNLKSTDQAKISYRGITLFINYSALPPSLRRQRVLERDPFYTRIWFSSLLLTAALVVLIAQVQTAPPLTVDELPPRVATMIFQPPKEVPKLPEPVKPKEPTVKPVEKKPEPKPEPKPVAKPKPKPVVKPKPAPVKPAPIPKKLPTEVKHTPTAQPKPTPAPVNLVKGSQQRQAGGNQGEGARHAGTEGQAGKPDAKVSNVHQTAAKGSPNSNSVAKTQAQGQGNVESFFNGIDGSISKKLAAGSAGANAAAENLRGHGGFTTQGEGGLGDLGSGTGGGGKSMSVGLGDKGLGDGTIGHGVGRIGSGGNLTGSGRGRPSIEVGNSQDTVIMGGLDKDLIDRIIKQHLDQIRHCYELEANGGKADLHGRVMVRFLISASGRVSQSGVENSSLQSANVERCLVATIQRIVFPEPEGGGVVEVSYPFLFAPAFKGN